MALTLSCTSETWVPPGPMNALFKSYFLKYLENKPLAQYQPTINIQWYIYTGTMVLTSYSTCIIQLQRIIDLCRVLHFQPLRLHSKKHHCTTILYLSTRKIMGQTQKIDSQTIMNKHARCSPYNKQFKHKKEQSTLVIDHCIFAMDFVCRKP